MRTSIILDDKLTEEALKYAGVKTKREVVERALREFVENQRRRDVRELPGTVSIHKGYDYKRLRTGK